MRYPRTIVAVGLPANTPPEAARAVKAQAEKDHPDLRFVFIAGATTIAVGQAQDDRPAFPIRDY